MTFFKRLEGWAKLPPKTRKQIKKLRLKKQDLRDLCETASAGPLTRKTIAELLDSNDRYLVCSPKLLKTAFVERGVSTKIVRKMIEKDPHGASVTIILSEYQDEEEASLEAVVDWLTRPNGDPAKRARLILSIKKVERVPIDKIAKIVQNEPNLDLEGLESVITNQNPADSD